MPGVVIAAAFERYEYYAPGSYTVRIDENTRYVRAWVQAAGGSSKGRASPVDGSAGGGGGFSFIERDILDTEWGGNLTLAVGAGSASNDGGNSTLSGTLNGASVSVTANGGKKGTTLVDGAGGTASGGDTNLSGEDGFGYVAGPPGDEEPGTPGRSGGVYNGGGDPFLGAEVYTTFGVGHGGISSSSDEPGFDGYIILRWL